MQDKGPPKKIITELAGRATVGLLPNKQPPFSLYSQQGSSRREHSCEDASLSVGTLSRMSQKVLCTSGLTKREANTFTLDSHLVSLQGLLRKNYLNFKNSNRIIVLVKTMHLDLIYTLLYLQYQNFLKVQRFLKKKILFFQTFTSYQRT